MSVLVLQSHAAVVPAWIKRCTASVRTWADHCGYDYKLIGDELFDGIPLEMTLKAQSRLPLTDYGRLLWIKRLLARQEHVIWIDADVLVFDKTDLRIDIGVPFLVCREILLVREKRRRIPRVAKGFNPTVLMFRRDAEFLDQWLVAIEQAARDLEGLGDAEFGREMLRRIAPSRGLPAVTSVGHFNAVVLKELFGHDGPALSTMMRHCGGKLAAANLCGHYNLPAFAYRKIIDRLLATEGGIVNDHLKARKTPQRG